MTAYRLMLPCGLLLALAAIVAPLAAQTAIPVDEGVQDIDPLARSLRQVPLGLRTTGEHTSVFAVPVDPSASPSDQPTGLYQPYGEERFSYYRIGPGFRARMDRIDYLVRVGKKGLAMNVQPRRDGEFIEVIGPNTYFDLRPQWPNAPVLGAPEPLVLHDEPVAVNPPVSCSTQLAAPAVSGAQLVEMPVTGPIEGRIDGRINGRVR